MPFPFLPLHSPVGRVTEKSIGPGAGAQDLPQADGLTLSESINFLEPQCSHL